MEQTLNYDKLEQELKRMKPRQRLYELVKAEMIRRDRWKIKRPGAGFKKGHDPNRKPMRPIE